MIPIFLACDENYVKYAAVTISSIISNTNSEISFYMWATEDFSVVPL